MANNSAITYVFSIDITRIYADGHEEGLDDMQAAKRFDTEEEAVAVAKSIADSYKDDKDVVQVYVRAEMTDGDDYGEPFTIFTASSKDRVATAHYRYKANYVNRTGIDYYAIPSKDNHRLTVKEITTGVAD